MSRQRRPAAGHNGEEGVAFLKGKIRDLERLALENRKLNIKRAETFQEIRELGYDPNVVRTVLKRRGQDPKALAQRDAAVLEMEQLVADVERLDESDADEARARGRGRARDGA